MFEAGKPLPYADATFELVYSSHALEHLDTPTVTFVLAEARRVVKPGGALVIKIPDFERILGWWRDGNAAMFSDELWGFPAVTPTFLARGLPDTLDTRAAYIFCGFWNRAYGNLYAEFKVAAPGAYNGPAPMTAAEIHDLLMTGRSNHIAATMRRRVVERETDYTFNHQNAWSVAEFTAVLDVAGFEMLSTDSTFILERFAYIPCLEAMHPISAYYFAVPR